MKHGFEVTGHGLQVDKVQIRPGSQLFLSGQPPAHWSRFGDYHAVAENADAPKKELQVATPQAGKDDSSEPDKGSKGKKG